MIVINSLLAVGRLRRNEMINGIWVTVVQAYAPTEDSSLMIKDEFILKLQEMFGKMALSHDCDG